MHGDVSLRATVLQHFKLRENTDLSFVTHTGLRRPAGGTLGVMLLAHTPAGAYQGGITDDQGQKVTSAGRF